MTSRFSSIDREFDFRKFINHQFTKGHDMKKKITRTGLALAAIAGLVACGDDSNSTETQVPSSEVPSTEVLDEKPIISIQGAWARTSPSMVTMGAAYMTIMTTADDELIDVAVDASVAADAQIHEMVMAGSMMGSDTTMMGSSEMMMQEVDKIAVPTDGGVELKPGGYHVMLIDLVAPLEVGQTIDITLTFTKAGNVVVPVTVSDEAP